MTDELWYNKEAGDENIHQDIEETGHEEFSCAVREILDSEGTLGYALGKPVLFDESVWVQICILDPQNELYREVKAYIQNRIPFKVGIEKPVSANDFEYKYDSQSDTYDFVISDGRVLKNYPNNMISGSFNRVGNIDGLRL